MKIVIQFALCTMAVLFVGKNVVRFFASDETRIAWTVEGMVEGFNDARLSPTIAPFHRDWRAEGTQVSRPLLMDGLRSIFFTEKHAETKAFAYEAHLVEDSLAIDVQEDRADVTFEIDVWRLDRDPPSSVWRVRLKNRFIDDPDNGWQVLSSTPETLEGTDLSSIPK